jgi:hypothetical protein
VFTVTGKVAQAGAITVTVSAGDNQPGAAWRRQNSVRQNVALPPPAIEVVADGPSYDELPVTFDDAVPGGARVKLRFLHC